MARVIGVAAIVGLGVGIAFSEGGSMIRKALWVVFGLAIAFNATTWGLGFLGFSAECSFEPPRRLRGPGPPLPGRADAMAGLPRTRGPRPLDRDRRLRVRPAAKSGSCRSASSSTSVCAAVARADPYFFDVFIPALKVQKRLDP